MFYTEFIRKNAKMDGKEVFSGFVFKRSRTVRMVFAFFLLIFFGFIDTARAENTKLFDRLEGKIESLEQNVKKLMEEIKILKRERETEKVGIEKNEKSVSELQDTVEKISQATLLNEPSWINKFNIGGYGEMHANFTMEDDQDKFDIHRLVFYVGYDFNEWIKFHSEIELEHAFVSDGDGELSIEQAYVDFLLSKPFNVRVGRILTPIGIINKKHEPPSFNGVERPSFAKYIIPSTWSSDGVGIFGSLSPTVKYEAYVVGGLDGSAFTAKNGIRGGRLKERPSLNDPAITGRLDFYPLAARTVGYDQRLRLGLSAYFGGLDNGDEGKNPGINGDIAIYSGDFEYSIKGLDMRGAIAFEDIEGALEIGNDTADEIFGWYLEAGYHVLPETCKKGLLEKADAVAFLRYDDYDTQYKLSAGSSENPAGDRSEWTFGLNFYPIPNFVIKADYIIREDGTNNDLKDLFNMGIGWQF